MNSYGFCPICGAPGVFRERRLNGNDSCERGHDYPSSTALTAPRTSGPLDQFTDAELAAELAKRGARVTS